MFLGNPLEFIPSLFHGMGTNHDLCSSLEAVRFVEKPGILVKTKVIGSHKDYATVSVTDGCPDYGIGPVPSNT